MGISLTGLTPATTYDALIKVGDNGPITGALKVLSDGLGTNLPMEASTTAINFTGTLTQAGTTLQPTLVSGTNIKTINGTSVLGSGNIAVVTSPSGVAGAIQFSDGSAFASDATNFFWDDTNNRLGIGTNAPTQRLEVVGQSRFSDNILLTTDFKHIGRDINNSAISFASINSNIQAKISTGGNFNVYNSAVALLRFNVSAGGQTTISGGGSTSATTSLLVQNSGGTNWLQVKDDGDITNGANGTSELKFQMSPVANKFFRLTRQSTTVDFYAGNGGNAAIETGGGQPFSLIASSAYLTLSNGGVSIGATLNTTNASAILDVTSTTKGVLFPRMTTTQRDLISSVATGLVLYNTTTNKLQCYNGSTWNDLF